MIKKYITRNDLIIFDNNFNDPLFEYIDIINNHKTIFFGIAFDSDISAIPPNITTIIFDTRSRFNQEIKDISFNIKKIIFGFSFNKNLDYLPDSIEEIEFYYDSTFNSNLSNLPNSLKKLTLGHRFSQSINSLPSELEYLKLSSCYNQEIKIFPQKLKCLYFYNNKPSEYFDHDIRANNFNNKLINFYNWDLINLPNNLIEIKYPEEYKFPIKKIPDSLKIINIHADYKYLTKLQQNYPSVKIIKY